MLLSSENRLNTGTGFSGDDYNFGVHPDQVDNYFYLCLPVYIYIYSNNKTKKIYIHVQKN